MSTMTNNELTMLNSYISASKHYLEFGSGESTIYASDVSTIQTIDSIESSETYVKNNLMPLDAITTALSAGKLKFHLVDIGQTIEWGYPKDKQKEHLWPNYSLGIFSQKNNYDLVLIDGRFRVACTLSSIINTHPDCIIMIHDFWIRPEYFVILDHLDCIERTDTLGVFRKKEQLNITKIQNLIKVYQYLPGDKTD